MGRTSHRRTLDILISSPRCTFPTPKPRCKAGRARGNQGTTEASYLRHCRQCLRTWYRSIDIHQSGLFLNIARARKPVESESIGVLTSQHKDTRNLGRSKAASAEAVIALPVCTRSGAHLLLGLEPAAGRREELQRRRPHADSGPAGCGRERRTADGIHPSNRQCEPRTGGECGAVEGIVSIVTTLHQHQDGAAAGRAWVSGMMDVCCRKGT